MRRFIQDQELSKRLKIGALNFGHDDIYDWSSIANETLKFIL